MGHMKTIDDLIAEYEEATGNPMDGTARGCLWDAWQGGRREERAACADIARKLACVGGLGPLGKAVQIQDAILQRTVDEDRQAKEAEEDLAKLLDEGVSF